MSDDRTAVDASPPLDEPRNRARRGLWPARRSSSTRRRRRVHAQLARRRDRGAGRRRASWKRAGATWSRAARRARAAQIAREYDALFGGVGKPEVYLFGSHYLTGFLNEKPLAALRTDLRALGLARDEAMPETEDHIAYLCEVMRYLIAGDDVGVSNLAAQRRFFDAHLRRWVAPCATP